MICTDVNKKTNNKVAACIIYVFSCLHCVGMHSTSEAPLSQLSACCLVEVVAR